MAKTMDKVSDVRPFIERALKDEQIRENVREAFDAVRKIYDEVVGSGPAAGAMKVATNEDVHENLRKAAEELRRASNRARGVEDHGARNTVLLLLGIGLGLLFNPFTGRQTREWLSDRLFGGEETFDYTSGDGSTTTTPTVT